MKVEDTKTGNFLKAIKKYADEQEMEIQKEVERFRAEEIAAAQNEGLKDAYLLVEKEVAAMKSEIASQLATKEFHGKQALFKLREEAICEIFKSAEEKLLDFTKTNKYKEKLKDWIAETADLVKDNDVFIECKKSDVDLLKELCTAFSGKCKISENDNIRIGGFTCECTNMGIIIDQTFDEKLNDQHHWFRENADLQIV